MVLPRSRRPRDDRGGIRGGPLTASAMQGYSLPRCRCPGRSRGQRKGRENRPRTRRCNRRRPPQYATVSARSGDGKARRKEDPEARRPACDQPGVAIAVHQPPGLVLNHRPRCDHSRSPRGFCLDRSREAERGFPRAAAPIPSPHRLPTVSPCARAGRSSVRGLLNRRKEGHRKEVDALDVCRIAVTRPGPAVGFGEPKTDQSLFLKRKGRS